MITKALFSGGPMNGKFLSVESPLVEYEFPIMPELTFTQILDDITAEPPKTKKAIYIRTELISKGAAVFEFRGIFPN